MENKGLAIIAAILVPWALLSYAAYKYVTLSTQTKECECRKN